MPGWWFTIESTTSQHLIHQFKLAIRDALATKADVRAMMRARSLLQRFPVVQWREDLEKLQSAAIQISAHQKQRSDIHSIFRSLGATGGQTTPAMTAPNTAPSTAPNSTLNSRAPSPSRDGPGHPSGCERKPRSWLRPTPRSACHVSSRGRSVDARPRESLSTFPPAQTTRQRQLSSGIRVSLPEEHGCGINPSEPPVERQDESDSRGSIQALGEHWANTHAHEAIQNNGQLLHASYSPGPSTPGTPTGRDGLLSFEQAYDQTSTKRRLSVKSMIGGQKDFNLQKVDPFFTDSTLLYYNKFEKLLNSVDARSSENELCIEKYLIKSEKRWFARFNRAKLGMSAPAAGSSPSVFQLSRGGNEDEGSADGSGYSPEGSVSEEFVMWEDYVAPTGLRKLLQRKIGDWQLYCFLLAFVREIPHSLTGDAPANVHQGQIIAANSYQITLLTGEDGQVAVKLYVVALIYLVASLFWWLLFRKLKSIYVLALPFLFYGVAFFVVGIAPYTQSLGARGWIYNIATGFYAFASASGSFFFTLNFGTEGKATRSKVWPFLAPWKVSGSASLFTP